MISISIDMWPYGVQRYKYRMANIFITNDDTGTKETGNYEIVWEELSRANTVSKTWTTKTKGFTRQEGVLALLAEVMKGMDDADIHV